MATPEQEASQKKAQEKTLDNILAKEKAISAVIEKRLTTVSKEQTVREAIADAEKEAESFERSSLTLIEKKTIELEAAVKHNEDTLKLLKQEEDVIKQTLKDLDRQAKYGKISEQQKEVEKKRLDEKSKELKKQHELLEKDQLRDKKKEAALKVAKKNTEDIGKFLGFASDVNETWLGRLEETVKASKSIGASVSGYARSFGSTFSPANIFASTVSKIAESTLAVGLEMDNTLAAFNKTTGAGGQYNKVIDDVRFGSLQAGIGLQESATAVQALYENLTIFSQISKSSQVELSRTTAELEKLGIAGEVTAKNLDISTKALGMNVTEAVDAQKQIAAEAQKLGVAPGKLAQEFSASIPKLAQYGKQSVQIFKDLATQSKATGISIDSLISITQQFDTFEGAARSAGKLNAILGGNLLNSTELLAASESERVDMLRQSIQLSGRNWQELSKFDKMALASAAGIKDMNEANRLFGTSAEEFDKVRKAQDTQALSEANLRKQAESATSAQQKFTLVMQSLSGAALPLLNILSDMLNVVLGLADGWGKYLFVPLILITGAFYGLFKIISLLNAAKKALIVIEETFGVATVESTVATEGETVAKNSSILASLKKIATAAYEKASTIASTIATKAQAAGEWLLNAAKNANILSTLKNIAQMIIEEATVIAVTAAMAIYEGVQWLVNVAKNANILSTITSLALWAAEEIGVIAATVALAAYEIVQGIATAAMWLFNAALAANPIGLVVIAIIALIAGIVLLVKYFSSINQWIQDVTGGFLDFWDVLSILLLPLAPLIQAGKYLYNNWSQVKGVFSQIGDIITGTIMAGFNFLKNTFNSINKTISDLTGGFMDIYDVLLILGGPITWFIEIGKKVYENWGIIIDGLKGFFVGLGQTVSSVFSKIWEFIKTPINLGIQTINTVISKANVLPGVNIPSIPELAEGTTNFAGGLALVGEQGPELVSLPRGSNVITNDNASKLSSAGNALSKSRADHTAKQTQYMEQMAKTQEKAEVTAPQDRDSGERNIILELDGRELGRAIVNILDSKMKFNLT